MFTKPLEALRAIKSSLYNRKSTEELAEIVNSGISCETLASTVLISAFTKGMMNPDVVEILKPFLAIELFKIADKMGVTNPILFNKPIEDKVYENEDVLQQFQTSIGHESMIKDREVDALIKEALNKEYTDGFIDKGEV